MNNFTLVTAFLLLISSFLHAQSLDKAYGNNGFLKLPNNTISDVKSFEYNNDISYLGNYNELCAIDNKGNLDLDFGEEGIIRQFDEFSLLRINKFEVIDDALFLLCCGQKNDDHINIFSAKLDLKNGKTMPSYGDNGIFHFSAPFLTEPLSYIEINNEIIIYGWSSDAPSSSTSFYFKHDLNGDLIKLNNGSDSNQLTNSNTRFYDHIHEGQDGSLLFAVDRGVHRNFIWVENGQDINNTYFEDNAFRLSVGSTINQGYNYQDSILFTFSIQKQEKTPISSKHCLIQDTKSSNYRRIEFNHFGDEYEIKNIHQLGKEFYVTGVNDLNCFIYKLDKNLEVDPSFGKDGLFVFKDERYNLNMFIGGTFLREQSIFFSGIGTPASGLNEYLMIKVDLENTILTENLENPLDLYPNPVQDILNIPGLNIEAIEDLRIFDFRGVDCTKMCVKNKNTSSIDVARLSAGQYFIQSTDQKISQTFIKM